MYKTIFHTRTSSKWEKILYDENAGNRHDSFIKDIQYYCHTIPSATVWGTAGKYQMTIGEIYNPRHWERWEVGEFKIFRVTGSAEAEQKGAMIRDLLHEILSAYTVGREPSRASFWGGGNSGGELSIDQVFWVLLENSTRDVNKNCLTRQKRLFLQIFILKFIVLGPLFFIPHKCGSGMETLTTEQNGIVPPQLKISTFHQRQNITKIMLYTDHLAWYPGLGLLLHELKIVPNM